MSLPNYNTQTLAPPRIPYSTFVARLKTKNSPAVPQAKSIYDAFVYEGVDPSFALAQYRVESQYGTAGIALVTKSWGNMLYDASLCPHAVGQYAPGNGYTYAKYIDVYSAALDYVNYLHNYAIVRNLHTIYEVTAEWIGKTPGSSGHISYTDIIINDMIAYETKPGEFYETGDVMLWADLINTSGKITKKYPITTGTTLYRGTNGDVLKKYSGKDSFAYFIGLAQGSTDWGAILINTSSGDPNGYTLVYIKNIDKRKLVNA